MSTLSLRLPDSLHDKIKKLASEDGISINQFVVSAVAEKTSAFLTRNYLEERGQLSSKEKFKKAMSKITKRDPDEFDKL